MEDLITILSLLKEKYPDSSSTTLRSWIGEGRVLIEGVPLKKPSELVARNSLLTVVNRNVSMPHGLRVIYKDPHLIAVDKPSGLLSVATAFETKKTVHAILKEQFRPKRVHVVHRLDQDTSGVMIFALTDQMREALKAVFERHDIERHYQAIVEGHLKEQQGRWEGYLYEDKQYKMHSTTNPQNAEWAVTLYKALGFVGVYTYLNLTLHTGKKNQIRLHCADAGHPVAGDQKYGAATNPIHRLCLHAHSLSFTHPLTKKKLTFTSPLPENFAKLGKRTCKE